MRLVARQWEAGGLPGHRARPARLGSTLLVTLALVGCARPNALAGGLVASTATLPGVIVTPTTPLPSAAFQPTAEDEVTGTPPSGPLPTSGATITPLSPAGPQVNPQTPTPTPCASQACASAATHFWLDRPIPAGQGYVDYVDRSYPYGATQNDMREPHHGVEFFNGAGTPIIAAAGGTVVVAGDDQVTAYGPSTHFYGNLVVVELDQQLNGQPVFNLYGHLQAVSVAVGDQVAAGDPLGAAGSTGVAIGPHLHFEVRVGANDYASTRNPELWIKPAVIDRQATGAIAGRVVDQSGKLIDEVTVVIRPVDTRTDRPRNRYPLTYAADKLINGDDRLQENFAIGDMPAGLYSVAVNTTRIQQQNVSVEPDQVAWVTFVVDRPPPRPTPSAGLSETPAAYPGGEMTAPAGDPGTPPSGAPTPTPADSGAATESPIPDPAAPAP